MVTIKDVANRSNTSYATVSRCLNNSGYVSKEAQERITKAIEDLNYEPNSIARSLVKSKSNVIGVLVPYLDSPFFSSFIEGVESEAMKKGYNIFLCHTHEDEKIEKQYLKLLNERRVDGIISTPVGYSNEHYINLLSLMPIVFAVRYFDDNRISSISVDDIEKSAHVVRYLFEKGHKEIGIISGNQKINTARHRWMGVLKAYEENGIEINHKIVTEVDYGVKGGYDATNQLLRSKEKITAIYAANNLISAGALIALYEKGYTVPGDISLAAFDGFEGSYAADIIFRPLITANIHPSKTIGQEAVKMVCQEIKDRKSNKGKNTPTKRTIEMRFIEKESVARLNN